MLVKRLILSAAVTGLVAFQMLTGNASSHREAPLISQDPTADNTDLYAFVSPDQPNTVTIIANYIPLEQPAGGPNFPAFDDSVLYEIHVDNNGDSKEDLTYQFRFNTQTRNPNTFLYNVGPITSLSDDNWNRPQTYSVTLVKGDKHGHGEVLGTNIPTPPDNIGPRSTPNYDALAAEAVTTLSNGTKVFAGQRDDPFFVDLGSIFDLAGLRPFNNLHILPLPVDAGHDGVANFNTHTIALQIPIADVVGNGNGSIGIYASASRQKVRVLGKDGDANDNGPFVQVSRLGQPLINEVVIPLGQKDEWNRSDPEDDKQFLGRYLSPEVTHLENVLYPALADANESNRTDLVAVLLTGVPGLNSPGPSPKPADLLRLNTKIAPTAAAGKGNRLGVLAGDLAGYPNGRRLEDDIVDIDLRAFAEGYGSFLNGLLGLPNRSPNNLLGDGVDANEVPFATSFPYVATPHQGYEKP
jgi:Domain of unknown function (DUF4331)